MNEFELIDRHFRREPRNADVRIGIGERGDEVIKVVRNPASGNRPRRGPSLARV